MVLSRINSLLGSKDLKLIVGILVRKEDEKLYIEDGSHSVKIDLSLALANNETYECEG